MLLECDDTIEELETTHEKIDSGSSVAVVEPKSDLEEAQHH